MPVREAYFLSSLVETDRRGPDQPSLRASEYFGSDALRDNPRRRVAKAALAGTVFMTVHTLADRGLASLLDSLDTEGRFEVACKTAR